MWTIRGLLWFVQVCTKALYESVKEAFYGPHSSKQTEDQPMEKGAFSKASRRAEAGFCVGFSLFFVHFCALIALWKSACTSKTITSSWLGKGVGQQELFLGAESVTKAMTSQLCFHSFIQGGGMSDSIQRALIQAQVYTNYLLGSARMAMPGSWEDAFVPLLVQFLSLLWASKGDFS